MKGPSLPQTLAFLCAIVAGVFLFITSQSVQGLERSLRTLNAERAALNESFLVLQAEWAYLNRPERLEKLAIRHLTLQPPADNVLVDDIAAISLPETIASGIVQDAAPATDKTPALPPAGFTPASLSAPPQATP